MTTSLDFFQSPASNIALDYLNYFESFKVAAALNIPTRDQLEKGFYLGTLSQEPPGLQHFYRKYCKNILALKTKKPINHYIYTIYRHMHYVDLRIQQYFPQRILSISRLFIVKKNLEKIICLNELKQKLLPHFNPDQKWDTFQQLVLNDIKTINTEYLSIDTFLKIINAHIPNNSQKKQILTECKKFISSLSSKLRLHEPFEGVRQPSFFPSPLFKKPTLRSRCTKYFYIEMPPLMERFSQYLNDPNFLPTLYKSYDHCSVFYGCGELILHHHITDKTLKTDIGSYAQNTKRLFNKTLEAVGSFCFINPINLIVKMLEREYVFSSSDIPSTVEALKYSRQCKTLLPELHKRISPELFEKLLIEMVCNEVANKTNCFNSDPYSNIIGIIFENQYPLSVDFWRTIISRCPEQFLIDEFINRFSNLNKDWFDIALNTGKHSLIEAFIKRGILPNLQDLKFAKNNSLYYLYPIFKNILIPLTQEKIRRGDALTPEDFEIIIESEMHDIILSLIQNHPHLVTTSIFNALLALGESESNLDNISTLLNNQPPPKPDNLSIQLAVKLYSNFSLVLTIFQLENLPDLDDQTIVDCVKYGNIDVILELFKHTDQFPILAANANFVIQLAAHYNVDETLEAVYQALIENGEAELALQFKEARTACFNQMLIDNNRSEIQSMYKQGVKINDQSILHGLPIVELNQIFILLNDIDTLSLASATEFSKKVARHYNHYSYPSLENAFAALIKNDQLKPASTIFAHLPIHTQKYYFDRLFENPLFSDQYLAQRDRFINEYLNKNKFDIVNDADLIISDEFFHTLCTKASSIFGSNHQNLIRAFLDSPQLGLSHYRLIKIAYSTSKYKLALKLFFTMTLNSLIKRPLGYI